MERPALLALALFSCTGCGGDDGTVGSGSSAGDDAADDFAPATNTGIASGSTGDDAMTTGSGSGDPASTGAADSSTGAPDPGTTGSGSGEETAAAGPTWNGFAAAFFESYCWECHGPGDALRDYSQLTAVQAEAATIRCGTAAAGSDPPDCAGEPPAGQFPIGDTLPSDEERALLVEWIDAGLPEG